MRSKSEAICATRSMAIIRAYLSSISGSEVLGQSSLDLTCPGNPPDPDARVLSADPRMFEVRTQQRRMSQPDVSHLYALQSKVYS
mmetsp:Transcript_15036/g.37569  ORF Transcript_15036/g.37569 Transcript_15036/m.37569 type:complete len:85 (+) Transcript_15036:1879-2133(+)